MKKRLSRHSYAILGVLAVALAAVADLPVLAQQVESAPQLFQRGKLQFDKRQYATAVKSLTAAIRKDPRLSAAYMLRGQAHDLLGFPELAVKDLTRYIELKPSDANGYIVRGDINNFNSDHEAALQDYDAAARLAPSSVEAHLGRGLANAGLERYGEAIKDYQWVLRLEPKNREALGNMGVACMRANRTLEAVSYLERAANLETDPKWKEQLREWIDKLARYPDAAGTKNRGPTRSPVPTDRRLW